MGFLLFVLILGAAMSIVFSLIAGLKDNVFAAQIALAAGVAIDIFAVALLILIAIRNLGGL